MLTRRHLRIKVLQALYAYFQSDNHEIDLAEKQLFSSIQHIYDLAIYQISFLLNLSRFAEERLEDAKLKFRPNEEDLNPNTRFIENAFLKKLESNQSLMKHIQKIKISWTCLLYTSDAADDLLCVDLGGRRILKKKNK